MIYLCIFLSPGLPRGLPAEDFTDKIRGGRDSVVISCLNETHTVLIPDSSRPLAISPTDWLHNTQVGVKKAISTPSPFRCLPALIEFLISGAVSYICPIKLMCSSERDLMTPVLTYSFIRSTGNTQLRSAFINLWLYHLCETIKSSYLTSPGSIL